MNIKLHELTENKTWYYLLPCIQAHGKDLFRKLSKVFKLSVGIHDTFMSNTPTSRGKNLFILCDKHVNQRHFRDFCSWVSEQHYYVADYCSSSAINSRKHMIVLSMPFYLHNAYDMFVEGKYSRMYTETQLNTFFDKSTVAYNVLTKSEKLLPYIEKRIQEEFGDVHSITKEELVRDWERELPPKKFDEVFNYNPQPGDKIFLTKEDLK